MSTTAAVQEPIPSTIPARLDRLGWSKFHTQMVCGLGAVFFTIGTITKPLTAADD